MNINNKGVMYLGEVILKIICFPSVSEQVENFA